jgi:Spy/CpxP family protein refolding chaperone
MEDLPVRKTSLFLALALVATFSASTIGSPASQTPQAAAAPSVDDVMKTFRADLQASRTDLIAKNVQLTADQAAKFWPLYQKFQAEQNAIIDEQLKAVQQYIAKYETLDDATAAGWIKALFDRDTRMNQLRQKWLPSFQEVIPVRTALRVIQIDRRLSLVQQMEISARVPLVH